MVASTCTDGHMGSLELAEYRVREIRLGSETRYSSGVLEVNVEGLAVSAREDPRVRSASFDVVYPGEKTRVTGIRDVVEPRVKTRGAGQVFPGILGPVAPVGEGRTHRLSGMGLVTTAAYEGTVRTGTTAQRSAILDMWGPGATMTPFASLANLVMTLDLEEGLPAYEAHQAIQRAEFSVALRLAETTTDLKPDDIEVHDPNVGGENLPCAVVIIGVFTEPHNRPSNVAYYGFPIQESLSTVIHPNELADGAITPSTIRTVSYHPITWNWQNQPLALGLLRDKRYRFGGVILQRIGFETSQEKEVAAHNAVRVAASLGADAALLTRTGSGNAFIEVMLTVRGCEEKGIKTVLVTYEYGGKDGADAPLLYYEEAANAVISTGNRDTVVELPAANRVVGAYDRLQLINYPGAPYVAAGEPLTLEARDVVAGGIDIWGGSDYFCRPY